jgi:uncharacterized protein (TIGR00299 family) protein
MKILYYHCFAGVSGDMNLAAMIDLGVEPDDLRCELGKLGLGDEFQLAVSEDARNGVRGVRVDVELNSRPQSHDHGHHHSHGGHRNLASIERILRESSLDEAVKETSLRIFRRVAEAEAKVHGVPVDEVHFHEVGATDAIVDIVGAAVCRHRLGVDAVWASTVELGSGFVHCAHGVLPVPAPATEEILHGAPTSRGGVDHEATTPTGAAILATLVDKFTDTPAMTVTKTGYGVGHRKTERPNLLRAHLADTNPARPPASVQGRLLQCNIDDMTGEMLGNVMDVLMGSGAMDVHFTPIMMKKNRPATQVSLLCAETDEARFKDLLFRHTTTLGIKSIPLEKTELQRRFQRVETPYGSVNIKQAVLDGEVIHSKPEYEDCKAIARQSGLPLAEIYAIVSRQK